MLAFILSLFCVCIRLRVYTFVRALSASNHHITSDMQPRTFPCMQENVVRFARVVCGLTVGPASPLFSSHSASPATEHRACPTRPRTQRRTEPERSAGSGFRPHSSGAVSGRVVQRVMVLIIYLRLAQALGRSSRVTGSHDSGGDGEGSGAGRPGELGDGLTKHLDSVDGCKGEGYVWG